MRFVFSTYATDGFTYSCDVEIPFECESIDAFNAVVVEKCKDALRKMSAEAWKEVRRCKREREGYRLPVVTLFDERGVEICVDELLSWTTIESVIADRRTIEVITTADVQARVLGLDDWFDRNKARMLS